MVGRWLLCRSQQRNPYAAVEGQKPSSDGVEVGPYKRIDSPFTPIGSVERGAPLSVEPDDFALHVFDVAMLAQQVAVAPKYNAIALDAYDAMQDVDTRLRFGQYGVAHLWMDGLCQQSLVAVVLKEGPHGKASQS